MVDPVATYEALRALRAAEDCLAAELEWAWLAVDRALRAIASRTALGANVDRDDARQRAFLRVMRAASSMRAESAAAAVAWLQTIFENLLRDLLRTKRRRRELFEPGGDDRSSLGIDALPAPTPVDPRTQDAAVLAPLEEALWDAVEHFTDSKRPLHRRAALRNAQLAYRWVVRQESMESLHAEYETVPRDTLYQWLRRGRVDVLLPAVEAWIRSLVADSVEQAFATALAQILREADRADAGKPRLGRRKSTGAVSPDDHWKSAQCDPDEGDDD